MKILSSTVAPINDLLILFSQSSDVAKRRWLMLLKQKHPALYNSAPQEFKTACWGIQQWVVNLSCDDVCTLLQTLTDSMDAKAILEVAPSLASMETARLQELANEDWFFHMSEDEQKDYIEEHPHSKYAGHIGKSKSEYEADTSADSDANVNKVKAKRASNKKIANLTKAKEKLEQQLENLTDTLDKIDDKLDALNAKMRQRSGGKPGVLKRLVHRLSSNVRSLKARRADVKESLNDTRLKHKAIIRQIKLIKRGKA